MSTIKQILISALATTQKRQLLAPWRLGALAPCRQAIDQDPDGGVETCGLCWSGMDHFCASGRKTRMIPKKKAPHELRWVPKSTHRGMEKHCGCIRVGQKLISNQCFLRYIRLLHVVEYNCAMFIGFSNMVLLVGFFSTRSPVYGLCRVLKTDPCPDNPVTHQEMLKILLSWRKPIFVSLSYRQKTTGDTWGISHIIPILHETSQVVFGCSPVWGLMMFRVWRNRWSKLNLAEKGQCVRNHWMLVTQCHKPSPSSPYVYRWCGYHSNGWLVTLF